MRLPSPRLLPPLGSFRLARFAVGDEIQFFGHIPHGIDAAEGVYFHVHFFVDGTDTQPVKFDFLYSYSPGYARGTFPATATVSAAITPNGVAKTHYIAEIPAPVLVNNLETDGLILVLARRVTNGGVDNADPVFVMFIDAHARLTDFCSVNKNFPFE